ncbi:MAG TPA: glycyl-radical enzyme activating protein [Clostridia bacterium]|nr:glycyl-radical enzyme activating protein [Clostridia bacterium]
MKLKIFKKGFNYSQDGTGNRLVYHLQGCNMNCPWCSNPEGISVTGSLIVNPDFLIDASCPYGAIIDKKIDRKMCYGCKTLDCINIYPNKGIKRSYEEYEIDDIVEEVLDSSLLFYDGGGVTLTGGEPTVQFEAVKELLGKLKRESIHTAIETNGTHPRLEELFEYIDMLIMDFKHPDAVIHAQVTGMSNETIKANIKKALQAHKNVLIRIPLIKGFNASEDTLEQFLKFFAGLDTKNASFEFLPYHEYGASKWRQIGLEYKMKNVFVDADTVKLFTKAFTDNGLRVIRT